MTLLQRLSHRLRRNPHQGAGITPAVQTQPPTPSKPKTLSQLEREMQAQQSPTYVHRQPPMGGARSSTIAPRRFPLNKLMCMAILLGIPIAMLWVVNLPYSPIRRPIARTAPILLLPSYISMDSNYRKAIALVEQAKQLIDRPTSSADLDLGAQKVEEAQKHLDALPIDWLQDRGDYNYWWYSGRLTSLTFNATRGQVAQLQAKVFQERNAQTALFEGEQALNAAKQQYQQAKTSVDQDMAVGTWQTALDKLEQIPSQTLAGRTAQQTLAAEQRNFEEVVGLAAGNQQTATLIEAARQFSAQAAQASQNPPHRVEEWQRIENLWQQAIDRIEQISRQDSGYAEAQKLLATFEDNLGQIQVRRKFEADSVLALQQAQRQISSLNASSGSSSMTPNQTVAQLQDITNQLDRVQAGTTAYLEAQSLLLSAQNKLNQIQPN